MNISAWRIVKRKHSRVAFTGEGARRFPGRWNLPGFPVVYAAGSLSLAALEVLVHLDFSDLLAGYVVFEVGFDESLVTEVDAAIGDQWLAAGTSAVLRVPSAVVPTESDFLLNPLHRDFRRVRIGKPASFRFDPRLGIGL